MYSPWAKLSHLAKTLTRLWIYKPRDFTVIFEISKLRNNSLYKNNL